MNVVNTFDVSYWVLQVLILIQQFRYKNATH